jgi:hypothetical protein
MSLGEVAYPGPVLVLVRGQLPRQPASRVSISIEPERNEHGETYAGEEEGESGNVELHLESEKGVQEFELNDSVD